MALTSGGAEIPSARGGKCFRWAKTRSYKTPVPGCSAQVRQATVNEIRPGGIRIAELNDRFSPILSLHDPSPETMKIRRVVSLTVLLSFVFLALSGIMLFLSPQGRVAYWSGWTLFGLSKEQYSAIHTTFMTLFLVGGIWHIVLNWRPITGYLKDRSKKIRLFTPESSVAMALTVLFLVGPLIGLFPFQQFLDAGEEIKGYWESVNGSPPWGHAEENSLRRFCRGMEDFERVENRRSVTIDCDAALEALRAQGLAVEGLDQRMLEIAQANGTTPQALSAIILQVAEPVGEGREASAAPAEIPEGRFVKPYSGLGRITLTEYATEYGYDLQELLGILTTAGLELDPEARLRDEASRLGIAPEDIISALNGEGEG